MNTKTITISEDFISEANKYAVVFARSVSSQVEYWAKIGKIAEENPDLPYQFIKDTLLGLQDVNAGNVSAYVFG